MQPGSTIRKYKILSVLHPGTGGNVYVVEDLETPGKFVLKSSFLEQSKRKEFENLISTWKVLSDSCENIVKFFEFFYEGTNSYIIMEYCEGGDLEAEIKKKNSENKKFTESEIWRIVSSIFTGLNRMHVMKLLHRDLKTANILLTANGVCKIADFNVSRVLDDENTKSFTLAGTLQYVAPEIFQNKGYSFSADVYSIGAVLYELLTLKPPFPGMDIPRILANKYEPIDASLGYSEGLVCLVYTLLALDPSQRPTTTAVLSDPALSAARVQGVEQAQHNLQQTVHAQRDTIRTLEMVTAQQQREGVELRKVVAQQQEEIVELKKESVELRKVVEQQRGEIAELSKEGAEMIKEKVAANEREIMVMKEKVVVLERDAKLGAGSLCLHPIVFAPKIPRSGCFTYRSVTRIEFVKAANATVCIPQDMHPDRVYLLDVTVAGHELVGLALKSHFPSLHETYLWSKEGTCFLWYGAIHVGTICVGGGKNFWNPDTSAPVWVTLELRRSARTGTRTLYFFVEGKPVPHCIIRIPADVLFVLGSDKNSRGWVDVRSLRSLPAAAAEAICSFDALPADAACETHTWRA